MKQNNTTTERWWLNGIYPLVWILLLALLLYARSAGFGYSYLDDTNLVLNQMDRIGHLSYIPQAFREDVFHSPPGTGVYYRPVLTVSFVLDAVVGNGSLVMFRISNIIFHVLAAWLLFLCLAEMKFDRLKSLLATLLFAAHPLLTQAIAWIPGRNDILLAIFCFSAFLFFIRYIETGRWLMLASHLCLWFLALFTKETALVLPLLLLPAGMVLFKAPFGRLMPALAAWLVLGAAWFAIRNSVLSETPMVSGENISSLVRNLPALLPFLGKSFFPVGLSVFPVLQDMVLPSILGGAALVLMIFLVVKTQNRHWTAILFGIAWFLVFLIPSLTKYTTTPELTEHRAYLPLAGIIFFIMVCWPARDAETGNRTARYLTAGIFLLLAIITTIRLQAYSDRFAFWKDAVSTSPSHAYSYNTLGAMYFLDGDLETGAGYIRQCLALNPDELTANCNMGLFYMRKGAYDTAAGYYRRELKNNPDFDIVHYNFGLLYYNQGKTDSALLMWEKTITLNPRYVDAYQALMQVYRNLGKAEDYNRVGMKAVENGLSDAPQ